MLLVMTQIKGRLSGKRAVVTGASSGIGRATALAFAREGATVIIVYRQSHDRAKQVVTELEKFGAGHGMIQADVGDPKTIQPMVVEANNRLSGLDIWANFAGADILTGTGSKLSLRDRLEILIDVDLRATILCSWEVAERMSAAGGGVILNMSWDVALHGMGGRNPEIFAAVKAGVVGFSKCLARSYAPKVRVNDVAPGWIETAFAQEVMSEEAYQQVIDDTPMARFGSPEDVAMAAVYLASDEAKFITGQTLRVNGGLI
jgi:3-oxoacyl-[acyl-carrier protein] reductase